MCIILLSYLRYIFNNNETTVYISLLNILYYFELNPCDSTYFVVGLGAAAVPSAYLKTASATVLRTALTGLTRGVAVSMLCRLKSYRNTIELATAVSPYFTVSNYVTAVRTKQNIQIFTISLPRIKLSIIFAILKCDLNIFSKN